VSNASPDSSNTKWTVTIKRSDGREQVFREVKHLVFAAGFCEEAKSPVYPGMVWIQFFGVILQTELIYIMLDTGSVQRNDVTFYST
jgi:cation diffusion facilitator CzcD-associated flavoprotein CzcO